MQTELASCKFCITRYAWIDAQTSNKLLFAINPSIHPSIHRWPLIQGQVAASLVGNLENLLPSNAFQFLLGHSKMFPY